VFLDRADPDQLDRLEGLNEVAGAQVVGRAGVDDLFGPVGVGIEINCADHAQNNQGPIAQVRYGFGLLYCMTSPLAHDGAGLGTCGQPESSIRALATEAGFGTVTRVAENPFNVRYALTD
jgi:hypothetical protein